MARENKSSVMQAIIDQLETGGIMADKVAEVNTEMLGTNLAIPVHYYFGERIIDKKLRTGNWVVCVVFDRRGTVSDQPDYRFEDWYFAVIGIIHDNKQKVLNQRINKIEEALARSVDELVKIRFGLDAQTIKDVENTSSGLSPLDRIGANTYIIEASVEIRVRVAICY